MRGNSKRRVQQIVLFLIGLKTARNCRAKAIRVLFFCCFSTMVVQLICNQQVIGSSPTGSSFWSYSEMVITSACHAEGPSSILGNSVKMLTANGESELDQLVDHLA